MPAHPVINPEALATIRFLSGFTQTELARRSGVRQTHISSLEAGNTGASGQTVRQLAKGDIVVVPSGVTHWFRDVQGPFLYYTVKVTGPAVPVAGIRKCVRVGVVHDCQLTWFTSSTPPQNGLTSVQISGHAVKYMSVTGEPLVGSRVSR